MAGVKGKSGGKKGRSGRKSKAEEFGLATLINEAWPRAKRLEMLQKWADRAGMGDLEAGKLLMAYGYGKPTEHHELKFDLSDLSDEELQLLERVTSKLAGS